MEDAQSVLLKKKNDWFHFIDKQQQNKEFPNLNISTIDTNSEIQAFPYFQS